MARTRKLLCWHQASGTFYAKYRDPATGRVRRKHFAETEKESLRQYIDWHAEAVSAGVAARDKLQDALALYEQANKLRAAFASHPLAARHGQKPAPPPEPVLCGKRLRNALDYWRSFKRDQGRSNAYLAEVARYFGDFVRCVGNKPVEELTLADLVKYERATLRERTKGERSNKWLHDRLECPLTVFEIVKRKATLGNGAPWPLPPGLLEWCRSHEHVSCPPASDRRAVSPADYAALLATCQRWAAIDPERLPKATQADKAARLKAYDKQREGKMLAALLPLALYGLERPDFRKLQWSDVNLDGAVPSINAGRGKMQWKVGAPVPRVVPLFPEQVAALRAWKPHAVGPYVFTSSRGTPYPPDTFANAYIRLCGDSDPKVQATFKRFRKVPANVARAHDIADWKARALLGQTARDTMGKHYVDDPQPELLQALADAIRAEYYETAGEK